jgi:hypothetical protein
MGRSFHRNESEDCDRRRVKKKMTKKHRNNDKAHLREMTSGQINEEDYYEIEEDKHGNGKNSRI